MSTYGELKRRSVQSARAAREVRLLAQQEMALAASVRAGAAKAKESLVLSRLADVPIEAMRDATDSSIRLEALRKFGLTSVASVHIATDEQLLRIHGVSAAGAQQLKSIAGEMFAAIELSQGVSFDADALSESDLELLHDVRQLEALRSSLRGGGERLEALAASMDADLARLRPLGSRLRWLFANSDTKRLAVEALTDLTCALDDPAHAAIIAAARSRESGSNGPVEMTSVRQDFTARAGDYYAVLEQVNGPALKIELRQFTQELLDRIDSEVLDTSLVNATMRRYQVFGSKFALVQNRVILGDEMGLGKTLQAIAVLAQRHAGGATHHLVVCPASVLVNWQREIQSRSSLKFVRIHGETQKTGLNLWRTNGGTAITTFDTIKSMNLTDEQIAAIGVDTVVIDEAHYVKNLDSGRSRHIARWLDLVPRAMLLTGTPLENRVEEFVALASLLDRPFAEQLNRAALAVGSHTFRQQVAPMYLRRNVDEVLVELPDRIEIDEYCSWEGANYPLYLEGVAGGNLMSMRRAGMLPAIVGRPANKMVRLLEIVEEAAANHHKVIVYSYFREVLQEVARALGSRAVGPITGEMSPRHRQDLVDVFTAADEPTVLVGQIQAAGTGLNIQAASVVILCEPQIKPSLEVQAIARAHRMGQVRKVQVHRLLIPESVDSLMVGMLARKQSEFDAYARESDLADAVSSAKDRGEEQLAKVIVMAERRRLTVVEPVEPRS